MHYRHLVERDLIPLKGIILREISSTVLIFKILLSFNRYNNTYLLSFILCVYMDLDDY